MDEKIKVLEGETTTFKHVFFDHSLKNIDYWIDKHNHYATREAIQFFLNNHNLKITRKTIFLKSIYYKLPLFFRGFLFFIYRYIFLLGFFDGIPGFLWHFHQCFWYRILIDTKIFEIKSICENDNDKIYKYIKKNFPLYI